MPTPDTKNIPLPAEGPGSFEWWKSQSEWAAEVRKDLLPGWRTRANAYRDALKPPRPDGIRVNIEYEKTEQKRHQLFYRQPLIKLRAHPRTARDVEAVDLKRVIAIFKEALSFHVGPEGANLKPTMDELIFDVLCPAGIAFAKVGYERHEDGKVQIPTGAMINDPAFAQPPGSILGLAQAPQIPEVMPAPNVVAESYYCTRISPAQGLIPPLFRGSDYSGKAQWLGHDFDATEGWAKEHGWTIKDGKKKGAGGDRDTNDDRIVEMDKRGNRDGLVRCREIFYFASQVDPSVKH